MPSSRHDRLSNLIVASSGNILSALISILYVALVGRALGPALYSDFNAGLVASYVVIAMLVPLSFVTVQVASAWNAQGNRQAALATWRAVVRKAGPFVALLAGVACAVIPFVARGLDMSSSLTLYMALAVAIGGGLLAVLRASLRAVGDYGWHGAGAAGEAALRLLIGAVILAAAPAPAWALSAYLLSGLLVSAATMFHTRTHGAGMPVPGRFAATIVAALILNLGISLASNVDVLIVKSRLPAADAGLYGAAAALARAAATVLLPIETLFLPALAHAGRHVLATVVRLAGFAALCVGPVLLAFSIAPQTIISMVFGREFSAASSVLLILTVNSALVFSTFLVGQYLLHARRYGLLAMIGALPVVQSLALLRFGTSMWTFAATSVTVQAAAFLIVACAAFWSARRGQGPAADVPGDVEPLP